MDQTNSLEPLSKDGVANIANPSTQNANTKILFLRSGEYYLH